ncbi:chaperone protein HscA [Hypericibacter adhaerens]|uniref:Chaperone protein HscA homolog n=1 Tax=Hypericibacter adhaerens TaxID=2602016 RepID=A0A5J6MWK3_9PROT|nr:Fe-S protein assembly chaperone HscA [Hypericibacter adhaerens]QEX21534.1 chaperone protein HscA [Hypericibacter adhaerens]
MLLQIHEPGQTPAPHEQDRGLAVGIDLGTTNSVVAVAIADRAQVLRDQEGSGLLPSVVAYGADGSVLVGEPAIDKLAEDPQGVVSSIKRLMGRSAGDLKQLGGTLPYDIDETTGIGMVRLKIRGRRLTPVEISADILRAIKARAEARLGQAVDQAVVTVPAYFDDAARNATKDAARLAGLEVLRLVNEPTAAALAYGLDHEAEGVYAVYDLGGGTFDISLLRLEKGVFQVLATGGDAALGGDDFDHLIAERFLAERQEAGVASALDSAEAKTLLLAARRVKEALTEEEQGSWDILLAGRSTRHALSRAGLETLIAPLVKRTIHLVRGVLEDAGVEASAVKGVVLVGGSTRVPAVRRAVAELFGREPLADIDPDEVVALGAALQAQALTQGGGALLLDVTPLSLGIETMGGIVEKVIPRNTPIPVAMAQDFTTYQDGQTGMLVHVLQGERETVDQCRSLGRFELKGIPPMTAGAARIRVTYAVDADGLLTVSAEEKTTGVKAQIEVKPSYGLSEEDMARMLRDSLENAREDMERRLLIEARVEAERVLLALGAALSADGALATKEERQALEAVGLRLKAAIAGEDRDLINGLVEELERVGKPFAQRRIDRAINSALAGHRLDEIEADVAPERVPPA